MIWIYLYLVILFIRPQDWPGSPIYAWPVNVFIMIGGLIYGLTQISDKKKNVNIPQIWFVFIFVCLAFVSNAANGRVDLGYEQFIMLFKRYLLFVMLLLIVDTPQKMKQVFIFTVFLTIIVSFQGIYQNIYGVGWANQGLHTTNVITQDEAFGGEGFGTRTFWIGDWDGPNVLALIYLVGIPFCLEVIFKKGASFFVKTLYAVSFGLLTYGICLTNSRGGFLALIVMVGLYYLFRFGKIKGIAIAIIAIPLLLAFSPSRMSIVNSNESSAHERTWLWEQGLNSLRENPIFGIGKGQFSKSAGLIAHNNFVDTMTETGMVGLFVYMALIYLSIKSTYIVYKHYNNTKTGDEVSYLSRAAMTSAIGFYAATFFVMMELDLLYVIWGLCAAMFLIAKNETKDLKLKFGVIDLAAIGIMTVSMVMLIWLIAEKHII